MQSVLQSLEISLSRIRHTLGKLSEASPSEEKAHPSSALCQAQQSITTNSDRGAGEICLFILHC